MRTFLDTWPGAWILVACIVVLVYFMREDIRTEEEHTAAIIESIEDFQHTRETMDSLRVAHDRLRISNDELLAFLNRR